MALLRPVVTCAFETSTTSVREGNNLLVFERQILLKIFGPVIVRKDGESEVIKTVEVGKRKKYCYVYESTKNKMVGTSELNGRYKTS